MRDEEKKFILSSLFSAHLFAFSLLWSVQILFYLISRLWNNDGIGICVSQQKRMWRKSSMMMLNVDIKIDDSKGFFFYFRQPQSSGQRRLDFDDNAQNFLKSFSFLLFRDLKEVGLQRWEEYQTLSTFCVVSLTMTIYWSIFTFLRKQFPIVAKSFFIGKKTTHNKNNRKIQSGKFDIFTLCFFEYRQQLLPTNKTQFRTNWEWIECCENIYHHRLFIFTYNFYWLYLYFFVFFFVL